MCVYPMTSPLYPPMFCVVKSPVVTGGPRSPLPRPWRSWSVTSPRTAAGRGAGTAALGGAEVGGRAEAEAGPWLGDPWGCHDFKYDYGYMMVYDGYISTHDWNYRNL